MVEYTINLIIGIILLILAIILYLAILEIRDNTKRTKDLLYFIARWQIDKDKTKWDELREKHEWDKFEEMETIRRCSKCGSELYDDSIYCPNCSEKISNGGK